MMCRELLESPEPGCEQHIDIEFPAGFYKAGTILDNDVQFNTKVSNGFRFTVDFADSSDRMNF